MDFYGIQPLTKLLADHIVLYRMIIISKYNLESFSILSNQ